MAITAAAPTTSTSPRHARRRVSTSHAGKLRVRAGCQSLSPSVEALDLSSTSLTPVLAALRLHVLTYLADVETRLSLLESPFSDSLKCKGESTIEEVSVWARTALEMLNRIRTDVCSHLPELHFEPVSAVEEFVKSHMPDVPSLDDMQDAVCSRLPDVRSRLDDVRSTLSDIDFRKPLEYIPILSENLEALHTHLSLMDMPHSFSESVSLITPSADVQDLLERALSSKMISELSVELMEGEEILEKAALEVARAVKQSLDGARLICYADLPEQWRNNRFVSRGYRFIPLRQWPLILMSLFALHNETVNIHTHLIPFLLWAFNLIPVAPFTIPSVSDHSHSGVPELAFTSFALLCLFSSAVWHTMAGCAHPQGMELCARIDYVGIGWLISASIGTVVYYGLQAHDSLRQTFLIVCLLMGVSGSIVPFMSWFNDIKYRNYRIMFFLSLSLCAVAPLASLSYLYSYGHMVAFIRPVFPSLLSYIAGLIFYATHFPECCFVSEGDHHWLDWLGGGSHAIWHIFIVLAISLHRAAMEELRNGMEAIKL